MNNILAAKVLMYHLPDITDGAYKIATEVAIEVLCDDAIRDWENYYKDELSLKQYLGFNKFNYDKWIARRGKN